MKELLQHKVSSLMANKEELEKQILSLKNTIEGQSLDKVNLNNVIDKLHEIIATKDEEIVDLKN